MHVLIRRLLEKFNSKRKYIYYNYNPGITVTINTSATQIFTTNPIITIISTPSINSINTTIQLTKLHFTNCHLAYFSLLSPPTVPPSTIEIINKVSPVELGDVNDVECRVSGGK